MYKFQQAQFYLIYFKNLKLNENKSINSYLNSKEGLVKIFVRLKIKNN